MATTRSGKKSLERLFLILALAGVYVGLMGIHTVLQGGRSDYLPETETVERQTPVNWKGNNATTTTAVLMPQKSPETNEKFHEEHGVKYPLQSLGIESAERFYQQGFFQRMAPVPLERWETVSNNTCIRDKQSSLQDWQRRVPHVVMIGAQKGGTTALSYYLYNHPSIQYLPTKELHFFDEDMDQNGNISSLLGGGVLATETLNYYQGSVIGSIVPLQKFEFEIKYALDATPNYMFASDRVPWRLFCVAPWVKLLAILRDPVDRAYSQYHMQFNHDLNHPETRRGFVSFEQYIQLDLAVLRETGVIRDWKSQEEFETFAGSPEELDAWSTYTKLGINSPVGRGLYAIQLRHWFQAMDDFNKSRSDLWIAPSTRLFQDSNDTYSEILNFLGLKPHHLNAYSKIHATKYRSPEMLPETRSMLQTFFEPYNRQLGQLLGSTWEGIWSD